MSAVIEVSASASKIISLPFTSIPPSLRRPLSIVTPEPDVVSDIVLVAILLPDNAVNVFAVN